MDPPAFCYCGAARRQARGGGPVVVRLPVALLFVVGWGAALAALQVTVPTQPAAPAPDVYLHTIAPGDTLIGLSRSLLADPRGWHELRQLNHIRNPRRLRPGSALRIPVALLKSVPADVDVLWVRGDVRVHHTDGTVVVALVGTSLGGGDRVTTAAGAAIGVSLSAGTTLTIGEDADVTFGQLVTIPAAGAARTGIDLRRGRIQNDVAPAASPVDRYQIRTPVVTTAVRGTTFRVGVDATGAASQVEVEEGRVGVAQDAAAIDVSPGLGSVARQGVPLAPPRALLPAVALTSGAAQQRLPARVRWAALAGAVRYRATVRQGATAPAPADPLVTEQVVGGTDAAFADLADGVYRVSVRGIDADGLEGLDGETRLELDARPEPPIAQAPALDAVVVGDRVAFAWARPAGVAGFDLEIAAASDGAARPASPGATALTDPRAELPLAPGRYTWRVRSRATIDGRPDVGPWSDPLAFTLKARPPAGPAAHPDAADKTALALRWAAGLAGDRYHVQLARDGTFATPLVDRVVDTPALSAPRPDPGTYAVRVAIVNADGVEGAFGPVQTFEVAKIARRSWWWILEPVGVLIGFLVAAN